MRRFVVGVIGIIVAAGLSVVAIAQPEAPSRFPINIDATQLFFPFFSIFGVTPLTDARRVQSVQLAPGEYHYQFQSGDLAEFTFIVTANGTVDYDHKFDAFLNGRGTTTLQLTGFEVTLDALSLTGADNGGGVLLTAGGEWIQHKTIRLLPQKTYLFQQGQASCPPAVGAPARCISFGLQQDGRFSYDPADDTASGGALSGAGTTTLTFKGHTVSVDASAVSRFLLVTTIPGAKPVQNGKTTVVVLPAPGFFLQLDSGMTDLMFSVGAHGEVMLDPKKTGGLELLGGNPPTVRVLANADPMNADSPEDVVTQRYSNLRTGTTLHGGLDQRAVSHGLFGLIRKLDVDGVVLAQPLFMAGVDFLQKGRRPAVFIATSTNWIYAFDAETLDKLWEHHLGEPFRFAVPSGQFVLGKAEACPGQMAVTEQEQQIAADGIQSTPVIDFVNSRMIVSYRGEGGTATQTSDLRADSPIEGKQRIAVLDLRTGEVAKDQDGHDLDLRITDDQLWNLVHRNRASLLLADGTVYVAFAGRCEVPNWPHSALSFQGWIYAFDAATLAFKGRYRSTRDPNGSETLDPTKDQVAGGGIWQASTGLASDGRSLYFATGNQAAGFQATTRPADVLGRNLPDSVIRLSLDPASFSTSPTDWFTPYRKDWLDVQDLDLASAGVMLMPNTRYLVAAGKEGLLYLLDREHLGRFDGAPTVSDPPAFTSQDPLGPDDLGRDHVLQKFTIAENQYCAASSPNPLFCLGPKKHYPSDGLVHRGVDMHQWFPWPHIHGTPIFGSFPDGRTFLYVWPEKDFLKSFQWRTTLFDTTPTIAKLRTGDEALAPPYIANVPNQPPPPPPDNPGNALAVGMPGGFLSLSIDPTQPAAGVLFASVQRCRRFDNDFGLHECSVPRCSQDPLNCTEQGLGILRAFDPITLRELWNNQTDRLGKPEDKEYWFAKFVPPTIAHGRVFLATGSKRVLVYGLREFARIRFTIKTGDDDAGGGLHGSDQTADVFLNLQDGTSRKFTVTLRQRSEPNWENQSTHTVDFQIPSFASPLIGVAGVQINQIQDNPDDSADNWDIASLSVSLFNPPFSDNNSLCQLNLVGNTRLQDGSTGLVRLSKNPGDSGNGPSSPVFDPGGSGSGCS
jgi:hypothetical protein